ncbi:hypothetical protein [Acidithiobacillus sp.]|uniref:hypothetical protein n=1 Tax=Acidithiobacillus sp. TaxID=1872118 RepID=UPI00263226C1|nr:hypothetical protein [Acidithiobacillus sp.]MDD5280862.1 hypothetical protein [Acidithiobacillus sp.]
MNNRKLIITMLIAASGGVCLPLVASATPAEIILLRHGEKMNPYALSPVGQARAAALARQYLGKNATHSLLPAHEKPATLMAITLHTIETMTPTAQSWGLPVTAFTVVPEPGLSKHQKMVQENLRTREAVHDIMTNPAYDQKVVVIMWEHKHIANAKLEAQFPGQQVTFRQLLHLDKFRNVPQTWPKKTFDYFWIIRYQPGDTTPVSFSMEQEKFTGQYARLPENAWGKPE